MSEVGGAPTAERTVWSVATDGIAYFVYWLIILLLLGQAIGSVLGYDVAPAGAGVAVGVVCLLWAIFCLGMGVLRGTRPDGADRPPPPWLGVVTTVGCLVSLEVVRVSSGVVGEAPWPSQLLVGGLLVGALTVWRGALVGGVAAVGLAAIALVLPLRAGAQSPLLYTWLSDVVPAIAILAAGFALALAVVALGRAVRALQLSLDARDEVLVRERAVRAAADLAAEAERSLHDTALNTLETIAAHGDHLDPQLVEARCRWDHERLSAWREATAFGDLAEVMQALETHAQRIGIELESALVEDPGPDDDPDAEVAIVPVPVLAALAGAGREAVTNVAKHAGVSRATLLIRHDAEGVQAFVADEGSGAGSAPAGFGVTRSIRERMESVGGRAVTAPGPADMSTVVVLQWLKQEPPAGEVAAELLGRTARSVLVVAMFLAGTACALIVLGWLAYSRGWLALVGAVAPVLVAANIVERARAGRDIGADQVLTACGTYVLVGALAQLADPYCAALRGEGVLLDVRAPMMAVLLLLAPRTRVLVAILATVLGSHVVAAVMWHDRWILCGPETAQAGVYVVAALAACWLFVARIDRLTADLAGARWQAIDAQVRIRSELAIRAEDEHWVADTLAHAQRLLDDVAEGRRSPADPATRARCATEAQYLRAWLVFGRATAPVSRAARVWLRLLYENDCSIAVRGAFDSIDLPGPTIESMGRVIDAVCQCAPSSNVTISAWRSPEVSVVLTAQGGNVTRAGSSLRELVRTAAPGSWWEVGPDGLTVEWFVVAEVPDLAPSSG